MLVDLFPTFTDLANTKEQQGLDGESIVPLFSGQTAAFEKRELFWHFPGYLPLRTRPCSVIRKGDFKLIKTFEDNQITLYNLRDDLSEKTNIAAQFPEVAEALKKSLHQWQKETGARIPKRNQDFNPANEGKW
jgi:arylsulfatase A-like enzyme